MENETPSKYVDPGAAALKWFLYVLFALCVAISLTGCNTFSGFGKDITAAAEGIRSEMAK